MTRDQSIQAIIAAADEGGTIQREQMLDLCKRGALPMGRADLHTSLSVEQALQAIGLTAAEAEAVLDQ